MGDKNVADYKVEDVAKFFLENVDAAIVVDPSTDSYNTIIKKGFLEKYLKESGSYHDLIVDLWFHFNDSNEKVSDDYQVFVDNTGIFKKKYSRKLKLFLGDEEEAHLVQLVVYPLSKSDKYFFILDEFDDDGSLQESLTNTKISTIQSSYLFSMYIDLVNDTTSSINVTEISDDVINYNLKYSEWRLMIVNMIWPEDKEQFLRRTDPEYLKKNFSRGRTASYDCMMQNLEGKYIWVKLIFSRAQTYSDDDYRFVFMVQDINENSVEILSTLKKYEAMAITDPLTSVFNHGEIEKQLNNALSLRKNDKEAVSVLMVDLDMFKSINDNHGHAVGDAALKDFAGILREMAVPCKALVGRWGGEEFVVICYGKNAKEAYALAENIRKKVEYFEFRDIGHITCSMGVTELRDDDTFEEAFNRIDKAMYDSKQNGRNKVTLL
ncbi:MAG: GGDEF domain-containing protein [Lachnospiraceae bacterium]|nr:GGDEF domain-containing protein [Lachnospiraceae bacterium]